MWNWIKARAVERSTWAGVGLVLGMLGVPAANEIAAGLGTMAAGAVAVAGIVIKEKAE